MHYYFVNMDELLEEVFRRRAEQGLEIQAKALASPQPLWALWRFSSDPSGVAIGGVLLDRYGIAHEDFPPVVASVLTTSLSRVVVMEETLGFTLGHAETIERVERWLVAVEGGEWGGRPRV